MKRTIETFEEANSITLKKGAKGDYTWEIKVYGNEMEEIMEKIRRTDEMLKNQFGEQIGMQSQKPK